MGYSITFVSLRAKTTYNLEIDGGGAALDGGAVTFETNEDSDADMFKPVRCQSGSFRYIGYDDHATWLSMVPANATSKPVKLKRATTTVWQGYIQPQVFENEYPGNGTVEHNFSVQCPLSVLNTLDIDPNPNIMPESDRIINNDPTLTFGKLLQIYIFGRIAGSTTITDYYFQGNKDVTKARLGVKVMWANFLDTDSQGSIECKYTCKQVLEEFCKFFGYTCRIHGTFVYFTQPTENTSTFTRYNLQSTSLTEEGTNVQRNSFSITGAMFVDTDNIEEVYPGIGKASVRSDINELDNLIEIPYDELYDQYNVGIPQNSIIVRPVDYYEREVYNLIRQPNDNSGVLEYQNDTVSLRCYMPTVPGIVENAGENKKYCRFFVYDDGDVGGYLEQKIPESKEQFSWRKCIEIFHSYIYSGGNTADLFRITSKQTFVISDGMLYINFKCDEVSAWITQQGSFWYQNPSTGVYDVFKGNCYAKAKLRIGNRYWNGSSWISDNSSTTFELPFTSSGAKSNRSQYGGISAPQYNGFGIPVTDTMRGNMEFTIVDVPPFKVGPSMLRIDINGFLPLLEFEIGFVRGIIEDTQHRGNDYTTKGGAFSEEVNIDLIWASDVVYGVSGYQRRMPAGIGYILGSDDKPAGTVLSMSGASVIPEQELANIIAAYGQTTHRVLKMNLDSNALGNISPTMITSLDSQSLFPLAISHNWRDDITTLTLISV